MYKMNSQNIATIQMPGYLPSIQLKQFILFSYMIHYWIIILSSETISTEQLEYLLNNDTINTKIDIQG